MTNSKWTVSGFDTLETDEVRHGWFVAVALEAAQVCLVFVLLLLLLGASFSEVVSREDGGCPTPHVAQCFCRRPKV